jgi:hypothetical protein
MKSLHQIAKEFPGLDAKYVYTFLRNRKLSFKPQVRGQGICAVIDPHLYSDHDTDTIRQVLLSSKSTQYQSASWLAKVK